ncbi:hypothetical protein [Streptomyces sp. NBC_01190]|uniref:hypothetical protein n=1 Tax=Streptomyces sp. NBC_01190 TaxID=2903767 RepID=UPI00386DC6B8|nr:hypothetical protein OG519_15110 [Streptomyces sp. NBC_01190]
MTTPNAPDDAHGMDPKNPRHPCDDLLAPSDGTGGADAPTHPFDLTAGPGPDALDPFGESADEAALRALLRDAVSGLHGSPQALDHLRRAIPIRRQRRRQALVGAAAAVVLVGLAVPALVRATGSSRGAGVTAASASSSHTGAPGEDGHTTAWGDSHGHPGQKSPAPGAGQQPTPPPAGAGKATSAAPTPTGTAPDAPVCASTQLGQGTSQADAPDSGGRVYGWFRLANVSDTACTVPSGGVVQAVAQGAADLSRIQVVDHTAGDPAAGLPAAPSNGPVVLSPGQQYEVAFAWVPSGDGPGGCPVPPTTPPPTTPPPTDTPSDPPTTGTAGGATDPSSTGNAASTQLGEDAPTSPAAGSVVLNHTPSVGGPVVEGPVIEDVCAGTVYTTPVIPEPADSPSS